MKRLKTIWGLAKQTIQAWGADNGGQLAAAIAFFTIFSIPPMLILALSIAGHFFDSVIAKDQLVAQVGGYMGAQTGDFVRSLIESSAQTAKSPLASIVSVVVLLVGASGIFYQVQYALNKIWNIPKKLAPGLFKTLKLHSFSFLLILGIGLLFLAILTLSTLLSVFIGKMGGLGQNALLLQVLNSLIFFITITILIALVYRVIPDKKITWTDVWLGAAVTALLFMLGKYAIGFYLSVSNFGTAYGAAGSLIVLLMWIFYSVQLFLLGAEFTHVYSMKLGSNPGPEAITLEKIGKLGVTIAPKTRQ